MSIASSPCRSGRPRPRRCRSWRGCSSATISRFRPSPATARRSSPCWPDAAHAGLTDRTGPGSGTSSKPASLIAARRRCRTSIASSRCCASPTRSASRACPSWLCPHGRPREDIPPGPYAVIHAAPTFRYKQWTREGWRALAAGLARRGLTIVATSGPDAAERRDLEALWQGIATVHSLTWPGNAALLAGARNLRRSRHLDHPSRRRHRLPDGGAVRADRSPRLGTLAGRRHGHAMAGERHDPESRQRLDRAESAALPALHLRGLRAAYRQRKRLPAGTAAPSRCWRRPIRRWPKGR